MFAIVQLLACYAVATTGLMVLALAILCQHLTRLLYNWSSSSSQPTAAAAPRFNGKV